MDIPSRLRSAAVGALLGTMVGDAFGADYEGAAAVPATAVLDRLHHGFARRPLDYTDDTQMALVLAEHCSTTPQVDSDALAGAFAERYEAWRGYGGGMRILVHRLQRGTPRAAAVTAVFPDGSLGNGAAMRVAPVGVLWAHDRAGLRVAAERSARATHVHPIGVDAAVAQACAVGLATERNRFGVDELGALQAQTEPLALGLRAARELLSAGPPPEDLPAVASVLGNDVLAHRSVPAALWAAAAADSLEHAVLLALGLGGDTDTIAAMAGAVRGAADGPDAIPSAWLDAMADGEHGRTYATEVAHRLARCAARLRGD